jgi:serine/threonine protein kinase
MTAAARAEVLAEGAMIGGRFRLVQMLGRGGMGSVYEADDTVIGRRVALKLLHAESGVAVERFEREARAASRISSRHVAAVYDFGRDAEHGLYMVMELVLGETLDRVLAERAPLPITQAAAIGAEIAEALFSAHRAEVVHRDLKPSNVIVLAEGGLKVLDFGIARMLVAEPADVTSTSPNTIVGTPRYMSPECIEGRDVGPAADLYALGIVLFELVTGRAPFIDDIPAVLLTKHLTETPPRLADVKPGVPSGFSDLVARLLAKDPSDRPSSARSVADSLRAMSDDDPVRLGSGVHVTTTGSLRRRRRMRFALVGLVVALLIAASAAIAIVLALDVDRPQAIPIATLPSEPEALPLEVSPPPEPVLPSRMELTVTTDPPGASLELDGEPATAPITLPADGAEHVLTIRMSGYVSETRTFRAERDQAIDLTLRRAPRQKRPPVKLRSW